ncbi:DUF1150 family protein [Acetobacter oeni]|uniref:DUF1150 domain-containing protein n=1 Tax=Acetobacter oeni TaxID=304077 RepID=A0A511XI82_9PROT|nr:DUF1150 family protein [Acetobacter oeni]MBB3883072.1 hypothetical protein [Acetobacter oeni]GBR11486.1 hypothetical protein AA21952_3367 [Acetobacter oeni LMG 21952]GEN62658.1 hypothetical protein AOE01nite_08820 [Acetobacter oeni]
MARYQTVVAREGSDTSEGIDIRKLTDDQFLTLGLPELVYIRKGNSADSDVFSIHAANGQIMGIAEDMEAIFAAIIQHQMVAVTIH